MKTIEMTGSPKSAGFKTKDSFFNKLKDYGFEKDKIKKTNNTVDILVTDNINSQTSKMNLAKELDIEIMTYEDMADFFELETDF